MEISSQLMSLLRTNWGAEEREVVDLPEDSSAEQIRDSKAQGRGSPGSGATCADSA